MEVFACERLIPLDAVGEHTIMKTVTEDLIDKIAQLIFMCFLYNMTTFNLRFLIV